MTKDNFGQLYDLEKKRRSQAQSGSGNPGGLRAKQRKTFHLGNEEIDIIEDMTYLLGKKLSRTNVTQSQILGAAIRLFQADVEALKLEPLSTWQELIASIQEVKKTAR